MALLMVASPVFAQRVRNAKSVLAQATRHAGGSIRDRLRDTMVVVDMENRPAREALRWWSDKTRTNLVVNWASLEREAIDPETPINLQLRRVPAGRLLSLLLKQISLDEPVIYQTGTHFVEVLTREEANRQTEVRLYEVSDLLYVIPQFTNAPQFDLSTALRGTSSGGGGRSGSSGGRGGGSGLFRDETDNDDEARKSRPERAEDLAQLIRDTIEPDIWVANGGLYASISYFRGLLVVRAPQYVHERIGIPRKTLGPSAAAHTPRTSMAPSSHQPHARPSRRSFGPHGTLPNRVASVSRAPARPVSAIAR